MARANKDKAKKANRKSFEGMIAPHWARGSVAPFEIARLRAMSLSDASSELAARPDGHVVPIRSVGITEAQLATSWRSIAPIPAGKNQWSRLGTSRETAIGVVVAETGSADLARELVEAVEGELWRTENLATRRGRALRLFGEIEKSLGTAEPAFREIRSLFEPFSSTEAWMDSLRETHDHLLWAVRAQIDRFNNAVAGIRVDTCEQQALARVVLGFRRAHNQTQGSSAIPLLIALEIELLIERPLKGSGNGGLEDAYRARTERWKKTLARLKH